jgi:hypothetical protein
LALESTVNVKEPELPTLFSRQRYSGEGYFSNEDSAKKSGIARLMFTEAGPVEKRFLFFWNQGHLRDICTKFQYFRAHQKRNRADFAITGRARQKPGPSRRMDII